MRAQTRLQGSSARVSFHHDIFIHAFLFRAVPLCGPFPTLWGKNPDFARTNVAFTLHNVDGRVSLVPFFTPWFCFVAGESAKVYDVVFGSKTLVESEKTPKLKTFAPLVRAWVARSNNCFILRYVIETAVDLVAEESKFDLKGKSKSLDLEKLSSDTYT